MSTNEPTNNEPANNEPANNEPANNEPTDRDQLLDQTPTLEIPEEYQGNETISKAKSIDDLCRTIANQETLIGKKIIGIPDDKSTPEEIQKFNEAWGVPSSFEEYELETSPEIKKIYGEGDQEVLGEFKKILHEAGVNNKQAETLKKGYEQVLGGLISKQEEIQLTRSQEFDTLIAETFGEEKEDKLQVAREFLKENVSDGLKPYLTNVLDDPKALALVADLANNIYPDLKPDNLTPRTPYTGKSLPELNSEIQQIISFKEFQDKRHPGHKAKKAEWLRVAKSIDVLKNSNNK